MGEYIKPVQAFKKLDAAKLLRQGVYIYGATGFGKTELIHQYFKNQKYIYIPCEHNFCDLSAIPEDIAGTVVIDNINAVEDEDIRNEIVALFNRKKLWLILAGRSKMPSWLFDSIIKRNMMLMTEDDLARSQPRELTDICAPRGLFSQKRSFSFSSKPARATSSR